MYENIDAERCAEKMTIVELCRAVGITTRTYWNYRAGGPIPSDKLIAMARLFGCSTDYLLGLTDKRNPA